ncbi:MAG: SufE family protein [Opitutae bacterium]|nr:SufE family protein [Opitutae bacterium]MCD8299541.1 SufE family protein [Opitutae bacterium]
MSLKEKHAEIVAELEPFDDPHDRFQYIIDRAKAAKEFPPELRRDELLVEGCTSQLWLICGFKNGVCHFECDADAIIAKGIALLICEYFDGATPSEIVADDADFLASVGIDQHLSPNRRNGLANLVARIHAFAKACG